MPQQRGVNVRAVRKERCNTRQVILEMQVLLVGRSGIVLGQERPASLQQMIVLVRRCVAWANGLDIA